MTLEGYGHFFLFFIHLHLLFIPHLKLFPELEEEVLAFNCCLVLYHKKSPQVFMNKLDYLCS